MLTKRKKKRKISWKQGGVCCVSRDASSVLNPHTARGAHSSSLAAPRKSHHGTDKEEMERDVPLVSKRPRIIFTNKIFNTARKSYFKKE